ncbi:MAG: cell division control protein 48 CDC48 [Saprospiraceae bacterium]|nr:MAG: cell division control protein 48 CDC48 [Saprospiraceae bacterium]
MEFDEINQLQEAVKSSPDNIPLRKLLCNALMKQKRYQDAEIEYKDALKLAPNDVQLKIGLANAFHGQDKTSLGLVIIEEIINLPTPPANGWLVYARLLLKAGQAGEAKSAYENAIMLNNNLKDTFLESEINLKAQEGRSSEPEKIKLRAGGDLDEEVDKSIDLERPKLNFEDVGGMEKIKEEIRMKIIHPLQHPEIYQAYGKKIGGGILLYGPPGCGKTFLARATAGQINSSFIPVGISDILDMYIGQSERNLHAIFQKARSLKPCVLFFDEVDALGAKRSDMRQSAGRHLINQFLSELDGMDDNDGLLVLGATNAPWHLDDAFRRQNRFGRVIFIPPPDESAREAILQLKLKDKPIGDIDYKRLAKKSAEFSGADLEGAIDLAIESKLAEAMRKGIPQPMETKDLEAAIKKQKPTTKEWFSTAKNYALFANEGGIYDEILDYLKLK